MCLPGPMLSKLRQIFRAKPERQPPAIGPGERVYAVGDIHGRLDLFEALIAAIEADDAMRDAADTTIVLLGDLVDRGPDSAGVLASARALTQRRKVRIIAGNHEEMFLDSFDRTDTLRHFLRFGGRETLLSYPIPHGALDELTLEEIQVMTSELVPAEDLAFIRSFEDRFVIGDYLFVHAGIAPGVPLELQKTSDMRWIREPFLSHQDDHGWVVIHGHTIVDEVELLPNRIGVDTGAYMSGRLSALCLHGQQRWLVEAAEAENTIAVETRTI